MKSFVHLHVHSPYSLLEGAAQLRDLVAIAKDTGMPAVGLADTNTLGGAYAFSSAMADAGIQPIIGAQTTLRYLEEAYGEITLIAQNETGFVNLMNLVSGARVHRHSPRPHLTLGALRRHSEGLICLSGGWQGPLDQMLAKAEKDRAVGLARILHTTFGDRFYVELQRYGRPGEGALVEGLLDIAEDLRVPAVASVDVYYTRADMHEAHDVFRCIARGEYFSAIERDRLPTGHHFKTPEEMNNLFQDIPETLETTLDIAQRCAFHVRKGKPSLPRYPDVREGETEEDVLTRMAREGLEKRLATSIHAERSEYEERLEIEIGVINRMGFAGYFLIVADFIVWAKKNGIAVGPGRGSGAGSLVAYSLGITDLDPLRFGLLFERFLNPDRVSMPDFDVDFCQERRGEVIDYVKDRYGRDRVAQIGTQGKLLARATLRDVGRVLGLPYPVVDRWARMIPNNPAHPVSLSDALEMDEIKSQLERADANTRRMFQIALKLEGLFRNASTHAAGVVIADRNLFDVVPLARDDNGNVVTTYDMKAVESVGLVKFDFLGLKTLDVIDHAARMIIEDGNSDFDIDRIDDSDEATYAMLSEGESYGVFQLESPGMRQAMIQIAPSRLEDLIALVSLYRPGPMENIPTYAAVKHGYRKVEYPHPSLDKILEETFGVIIYQEQVMQVARDMAGYSLAQADLLRRAMGKKIPKEMAEQKEVFVAGAVARGHKEEDARHVFDLVARFAEYGFNKSHAAAYALISYRTAWLKCHYPTEFLVANLNIEKGNADKVASFIQEGLRQGLMILPPDVNASDVNFAIEEKNNAKIVRFGLSAIRHCGDAAMLAIVEERVARGPYRSLRDLVQRTHKTSNKRLYESLVQSGACDGLHDNRAAMLAGLPNILKEVQANEAKGSQQSLFGEVLDAHALPDTDPAGALQTLVWEVNTLGLGLSPNIRSGWDRIARRKGAAAIAHVRNGGRRTVTIGGIVTDITTKTTREKKAFSIVNVCDPTGALEISMFNEANTQFRGMLKKHEGYFFEVDVSERNGRISFYIRDVEPIATAA